VTDREPPTVLTVVRAERNVFALWLAGSLPSFALVLAETLSGHFGANPTAGCEWLMKIVGLILAFLFWRIAIRADDRACRRDIYYFCLALSTALLLAIPASRMAESFLEFSSARFLSLSYLLFVPAELVLIFLLRYLPDEQNSFRGTASKERTMSSTTPRVFIGHGRSTDWREIKDFVQDRLGLPADEFNRVPVAGATNTERLTQMLDTAAMALLVLTAEDERADGTTQARMNVIHEVGLFQGRLGFKRAILLLEDGCAEFSNVQGLGQIRYQKGRISAAFEEVRRVFEREGLVRATA
jgi:hypothetical protein